MCQGDDGLTAFNAVPVDQVHTWLGACCASPRWVADVTVGRPYRDRDHLMAEVGSALDGLDWAQILISLRAHPRIGAARRDDSLDARWSRGEQAGLAGASGGMRAEIAEVNAAYEAKFGHLFLIFASGRTDADILAAARHRLGNDQAREQAVVRGELKHIVLVRVRRMLTEIGEAARPAARSRSDAGSDAGVRT